MKSAMSERRRRSLTQEPDVLEEFTAAQAAAAAAKRRDAASTTNETRSTLRRQRRRSSQGISGGITASTGLPSRHITEETDVLDDFDSLLTEPMTASHGRTGGRTGGISGGIVTPTSRQYDDVDVLASFPSPDPVESGSKSTQSVTFHAAFNDNSADVCLPAPLTVTKLQRLLQAALQIDIDDPSHIIGLESGDGVVLPLSLVASEPNILVSPYGSEFRVLLRPRTFPASHMEQCGKILQFAGILLNHDLLTDEDFVNIKSVVVASEEIARAVCVVYWGRPDTDLLLHMLRHIASYDGGDVDLTAARIFTVYVVRQKSQLVYISNQALQNLLALIVTRHRSISEAFDVREPLLAVALKLSH